MKFLLKNIKERIAEPLKILRFVRWVFLGIFVLSALMLVRGICAAVFYPSSASASVHPLTAFFWLISTAIITFFAFYVYRHGGVKSVWSGPRDISKDMDAANEEPKQLSLSYSEIKESLPADKWIVATVKGALSASVREKRTGIAAKLLGDIEYKLRRPVNVLYNYYVELSDPRFTAVLNKEDGSLRITVPALKFDGDAISIKDLTEFDIATDNFEPFIPAALRRDMPARLKVVLQDNYKFSGQSSVNMRLAMLDAQKSIRAHVENLLWQKGGYLRTDKDSPADFKWLPDSLKIEDSSTVSEPLENSIDKEKER